MFPQTPQRATARGANGKHYYDEYASQYRRPSLRPSHLPSDSHDLTLPKHDTRDSMVENMLSSFDKMPEAEHLYGHHNEPPMNFPPSNYSDKFGFDAIRQFRQGSQDSSHASDYSLHAEVPELYRDANPASNRRGSSGPKGRLSQDTTRAGNFDQENVRSPSTPGPTTPERRRKGGSASSSKDLGPSQTGKSRWGLRSRGSSIDQGHDSKSTRQPRANGAGGSILDRARPVPVEYHNFNAPGAGPSDPGNISATHVTYAQQTIPAIPPRASSQASGGLAQAGNRNKLTVTTSNSTNAREDATMSRATSQASMIENVSMKPSEHVKERQGFFKRVFGSSKAPTPTPEGPPQLPPLSLRQDEPADRSNFGGTGLNALPQTEASGKAGPNTKPNAMPLEPPPIPEEQGPVVRKKTSFFSRNRKKTVGETVAPSQLNITRALASSEPVPSPLSVSSFHKAVLSPHATGTTSPKEQFFDSREVQPSSARDDDYNTYGFVQTEDAGTAKGEVSSKGAGGSKPRFHVPTSRPDTTRPTTGILSHAHDPSMHPTLQHKNGDSPLNNSSDVQPPPLLGASSTSSTKEQKRPKTSPSNKSASLQDITHRTSQKQSEAQSIQSRTSSLQTLPTQKTIAHTPAPTMLQQADEVQDDGWVRTAPSKEESESTSLGKPARVWLQPSHSEECFKPTEPPPLPAEGKAGFRALAASPTIEDFITASSSPIVNVDVQTTSLTVDDDVGPTPADRELAAKIFNGTDDYVNQTRGALILGDASVCSSRIRTAYMEFFDFAGLNILLALRNLCGKLAIKGETQQVDRILGSFSQRWCDCNPNNGFKSKDVVHTICYSILLLNTDLHIANVDTKMTRPQFIKNTAATLRRVVNDEHGEDTIKANPLATRGSIPWRQARSPSPVSPALSPVPPESRESLEMSQPGFRLSIRPPNSHSEGPSPVPAEPADVSDALVNAPFEGTMKAWEFQLESILKEIYNSIRLVRLPLHGASEVQLQEKTSVNSLGISNAGPRRAGSIISKAPSDSQSARSRDLRSLGSRFNIKNRSRSRVYGTSTVGSSRTSLDDVSVWSPNASSTWSRSVFGKTQTSMSSDSLGSHYTHADYGYQQSIGFANALSQSIIREECANQSGIDDPENLQTALLEDESLELAGAPWAKEGIVKHKHHLVTTDKKAKDRNWDDCFAVVEKGYVKLFSFNSKASVRNQKNKSHGKGSVVGGGNWMDNAEDVGSFLLRQTIASALPPPGYSKTRPHVFALSLPTGAVHLFHVGTPEIAKEFVTTANYWSARLSKEPLVGGVSNIEYGWSDSVINTALIRNDPRSGAQSSAFNVHSRTGSQSARPSFQGSIRSSVDHVSVKARLSGDRIVLSEWSPPQQSMMASTLTESEQLESLKKYVNDVEEELSTHNELRSPMMLAFTPSHPNARKAMSNWERKSSYLLREIVKFRTYIESLKAAKLAKERLDAEKAAASLPSAEINAASFADPSPSPDLSDEKYDAMHRATTSKERLAEAAAAAIDLH